MALPPVRQPPLHSLLDQAETICVKNCSWIVLCGSVVHVTLHVALSLDVSTGLRDPSHKSGAVLLLLWKSHISAILLRMIEDPTLCSGQSLLNNEPACLLPTAKG